jgi:hypothetical protein
VCCVYRPVTRYVDLRWEGGADLFDSVGSRAARGGVLRVALWGAFRIGLTIPEPLTLSKMAKAGRIQPSIRSEIRRQPSHSRMLVACYCRSCYFFQKQPAASA